MKGIITFYEKPGCRGNAAQKEQLKEAGYQLQVVDMLSREWNEVDLMKFFEGNEIHNCVNVRAPEITSGQFDPDSCPPAELLGEMIERPILIKRPLLFYRGQFACGFVNDLVTELLGGPQEDTRCRKTDNCTPA